MMKPHPPPEAESGEQRSRPEQQGRTISTESTALKRKPTLDETIENVFRELSSDYGQRHGIVVPANFYDFFDSPLLRNFLACVVHYYFAFVERSQLLAEGLPRSSARFQGSLP